MLGTYLFKLFHSYGTKNKLKKHEKVCNNHEYWYIKMPNGVNKKLKWKHRYKSMKAPFVILRVFAWKNDKENKSYEKQKICYICKKRI